MAIPELVKFRAKYPDYNDIDDSQLAGMLAKKYPDAYGDLPGKVTQPGPTMLPAHGNEPAPEDTWRGNVSRLARPALEGGLAAAGGLVGAGAGLATGPGAPVASPALGVAGGGLGYAIGKKGADILDETLGLGSNTPQVFEGKPQGISGLITGEKKQGFADRLGNEALESLDDVRTGAMLEMGGAVLSPALRTLGGKVVAAGAGAGAVGWPAIKWGNGDTPESGGDAAADIVTGAAGGALAGAAFIPFVYGGRLLFKKAAGPVKQAFTQKGAERAAGQILQANTSSGTIYAKNAAEAAEIEKQIPGLKFTAGQRSNDPAMIKLERTQMRQPGSAAEMSAEQTARNNEALRAYYQKNFGGEEGIDDLISNLQGQRTGLQSAEQTARGTVQAEAASLPAVEPSQTGQRMVETLQAGKNEARKSAQDLYAQVPYEEVPTQRVLDSAAAIRNRTSPELAGNIPERANFAAREYAADPRMGTEFGPYADALADEARMITSGESGAKFVDGQKMSRNWTTRPSWFLKSATSPQRAANALTKAAEGKPLDDFDRQIVEGALDDIRRRPGMEGYFSRQGELSMFPEGKDIPLQRMVDFKSTLTDELRALKSSGANPRQERDLAQLVKSVEETLTKAEQSGSPAAELLRRANAQYRAYKQTYGQGAVGDILRSGARGEKTRIPLAQIPSKVWNARNLSAADDLIKAAPNEASGIMRDHAAYDLLQSVTDAQGNIVTSKLNGWLARNRPLLKKFGLEGDFSGIAKAQRAADAASGAAVEFERSVAARVLGADPERAVAAAFSGRNAGAEAANLMKMVGSDKAAKKGLQKAFADHLMTTIQTTAKDAAGNPVISNAAFQKTMAKYAPVMRVLYKDEPAKIAALNTMRKAYEVAVRNTRSPIGGGSDTAENVLTALGNINTLSRTATIARGLFRILTKHGDDKVNEMVNRALFDPDYAQTLIKATQGKIPEKELQSVIDGKIIQLDAYRNMRLAASVTGMGAASGVDE